MGVEGGRVDAQRGMNSYSNAGNSLHLHANFRAMLAKIFPDFFLPSAYRELEDFCRELQQKSKTKRKEIRSGKFSLR